MPDAITTLSGPGLGPMKGRLSKHCRRAQHKTAPHNDFSSRDHQRYEGVRECPLCGGAVRYLRVRGNLSHRIECANHWCTWTYDQKPEEQPLERKKPKAVSSRQWEQEQGGRC